MGSLRSEMALRKLLPDDLPMPPRPVGPDGKPLKFKWHNPNVLARQNQLCRDLAHHLLSGNGVPKSCWQKANEIQSLAAGSESKELFLGA